MRGIAQWPAGWHSFQELTVVLSGDFLHHSVGLHLPFSHHPWSWRWFCKRVTEVAGSGRNMAWWTWGCQTRFSLNCLSKNYLLVTSMFFTSLLSEEKKKTQKTCQVIFQVIWTYQGYLLLCKAWQKNCRVGNLPLPHISALTVKWLLGSLLNHLIFLNKIFIDK